MKTIKTIMLILVLGISINGFTQNIGINTTGSAPDASAMLDIVSTNNCTTHQRNRANED